MVTGQMCSGARVGATNGVVGGGGIVGSYATFQVSQTA